MQLLVLDEGLSPVPAGAVGELCVGGAGVSRGYLGRPGLTASRFVPDPYGPPGARLYRSGDIARRTAEGDVEYLGRADQQVKVRGFRIELGEVEASLLEHAEISDAAVLAMPGPSGTRLVGWIVGRSGLLDPGAVRDWLAARVPEHLVPAVLVPLERLPLTANGKLDRVALPSPETASPGTRSSDTPRGATEVLLAQLWAEVLELPADAAIGRDDNFFARGGDSIVALRLIAHAKRQGLNIRARDVFQYPTIAGLARAALPDIPLAQVASDEHVAELSPIEAWFFDLGLVRHSQWAQSVHLRLRDGVDPVAVARALDQVVALHRAFGLRYRAVDGVWQADYDARAPRLINRGFPEGTSPAHIAAALLESLDLDSGPLVGIGWIGEREALIVVHHLIIDTSSWYVLLADLDDALAGRPLREPASGRGAWQAAMAARAASADLAYWHKTLAALQDVAVLPASTPGAGRYRDAVRRDHSVSEPVYAAFRAAVAAGSAPEELLLGATMLTISELGAKERVSVTLERHGRDAVDLDTTRSVGWYTVLAPFVVDLPSGAAPERISGIIAEALCRWTPRAPEYLALRTLGDDPATEEAMERAGLPEVAFNFLGRLAAGGEGSVTVLPVPDVQLHDPDGIRPFAHEVLSWTDAAGMRMAWMFNGLAIDETTVARWFGRIEHHLERLARRAADGVRELTATPLQQGLIFHTIDEAGPSTYVEQITAELEGDVDPAVLRAAWQYAMKHHDALTTGFTWREDGVLVQHLDPAVTPPFHLLDLTSLESGVQETVLRDHLARDRRAGIALDRAPLMRVTLARREDRRWWLLWTHHHAIVDGWSLPVVLNTIMEAYRALRDGAQPSLQPAGSYAAYTRWRLQQDDRVLADAWRGQLAGVEEPCRLRVPRPERPGEGVAERTIQLPDDLIRSASRFAQDTGSTINSIFLAAWALALRALCGDDRLVLGVTLSGRHVDVPGVEQMVGLFINTVPLALRARADMPAAAWVDTVQRALAGVQDIAHAGLSDVQRWAGTPGESLFDTLYVFENYPSIEVDNASFVVRDVEMHEQAHYPLSVAVIPGSPFRLRIAHDCARIGDETAAGVLETFEALVGEIVARRNDTVGSLAAVGAHTADAIRAWSEGAPAAEPLTGAALFARAVAAAPGALAIDDGERQITYSALDAMAGALAARLHAMGISGEAVVGVCMAKGIAQIAAQLAVWKLGAAFLPLDRANPLQRLRESLQFARARVVLVDESTADLALETEAVVVTAPVLESGETLPPRVAARALRAAPDSLAYVIFTSGSTGRPKGVAVSHRGLANLYEAQRDAAGVTADDRLFPFASPAFDAAIAELLMALARGAALVLPPPGSGAMDFDLGEVLRSRGATNVTLPPAVMAVLDPQTLPNVRTVLVAGDAGSGSLFRSWSAGKRVFNAYGPTEATVCAAIHDCTGLDGEPTLGLPMRGCAIHVLGTDLQRLAPGVPGDVYLGGIGLARGYLHQPALTAASFVPNPFSSTGERLYRTGDRGVLTASGDVRFLGRSDRQVKLRSYRIELAEVEAVLAAQPGVAHAVALVAGEGRTARLLGFVQGMDGALPSPADLRSALGAALPHYMVPASIHVLADWPRTPNGKVNTAELVALATQEAPERPSSEAGDDTIVKMLAGLWASVLRAERIGPHDNFFDLGGDSISALQIASRARNDGLALLPRDVLECQTVAALASRVREAGIVIDAGEDAPSGTWPAPLLPAQSWFFEQIDVAPECFLLSVELGVDFVLDVPALKAALTAVVAAHEALRLTYGPDGMRPAGATPELDVLDPQPGDDRLRVAEWFEALKARIDPQRGPVFVAGLVSGESGRLLLAVHHLATDAVSMRLLLDDLWHAYCDVVGGKAPEIPAGATSLTSYARGLAAATAADHFAGEVPYWARVLQPAKPPACSLPGPTRQAETVRLQASEELGFTPAGSDVEASLLAALHLVLAGEGAAQPLIVERESHGRDAFPSIDLARVAGWFTAIHPFRLETADPEHVKRALADVPAGGVGYGALVYSGRYPELRTGSECWIAVNYLGNVSAAADLPLHLVPDPSGGDQDPLQRRARPLSVEARIAGGTLVINWIADPRLELALNELVPLHAATVLRMLRKHDAPSAPVDYTLDADEMAALLGDLSPLDDE